MQGTRSNSFSKGNGNIQVLEDMSTFFLRPCVPMIHVAAKWTHTFNQDRVLVQLSLQKISRQGVRTYPPMVLSVMDREIRQLAFF